MFSFKAFAAGNDLKVMMEKGETKKQNSLQEKLNKRNEVKFYLVPVHNKCYLKL